MSDTIGAHVPLAQQLELSGRGSCASCRAVRPLAELLRLTDRRRPWRVRLTCRPSVRLYCFRDASLSAADERLEPADPDAPPLDLAAAVAVALRQRHEASAVGRTPTPSPGHSGGYSSSQHARVFRSPASGARPGFQPNAAGDAAAVAGGHDHAR